MLSVLIVNWNTRDLLRSCLASLQKHPFSGRSEIILVDNASSDGSAEMVAEEFPKVRLLRQDRNLGYAKGNNEAFAHANGEWLLTLNPDTEVYTDTLDQAVARLAAHPKAGVLGARQIGVDGQTQRSIRDFPTPLGILRGSYRLPDFDYEQEGPAPQPMGTFLLFRREALPDPAKPFDEAFPIFFNEVDLLYRMRQSGWGCVYSPKVRVLHHGGESTKQVRRSMIWESHRSLARYFWKHHRSGGNAPLLAMLSLAIYAGAMVRAKGYDAGFRA